MNEQKEKLSKRIFKEVVSVAIAALLAVFVFVVLNF